MLNDLIRGRISVIIPLYNNEKYIINCINSVLNQEYENIEIIVVDDGSTDNGYDLLKNRYGSNEKIILIKQTNKGPSVARNKGISYAKGEWIMFIDSDDELDKNALNILISNSIDSDLVVCGWTGIYSNKKEYYGPSTSKQIKEEEIYDLANYLLSNGLLYKSTYMRVPSIEGPVAKLYSTKIIKEKKILFPSELLYAEDVVFNYNYIQFCKKINMVDCSIYNALRRQDSLSNKRINFIEIYDKFSKIIQIKNIKNWDIEKALNYRKFVWMITYLEKEIGYIKIKDFKRCIYKYNIEDFKGLSIDNLSTLKKIEYKALNTHCLILYLVIVFASFIKKIKNRHKYGRRE